jgi:hypothetical protein
LKRSLSLLEVAVSRDLIRVQTFFNFSFFSNAHQRVLNKTKKEYNKKKDEKNIFIGIEIISQFKENL